MNNKIENIIRESISVKEKIINDSALLAEIMALSNNIVDTLKQGRKVIFAGNGGSLSDSFHLATEFVTRLMFDREALPSLALGGNNAVITATGNDYTFNEIFARELKALGKQGDIFIAISTSGNSPNILKALETATEKSIESWGLTGKTGGKMNNLCRCIKVPSDNTARIQEAHITIGHIICEITESIMFKK